MTRKDVRDCCMGEQNSRSKNGVPSLTVGIPLRIDFRCRARQALMHLQLMSFSLHIKSVWDGNKKTKTEVKPQYCLLTNK